jgi:UDP-N-acetylmuramate dehydrogenase
MEERFDVPFAELTTLRVGGPARRLVSVDRSEELVDLLRDLDAADEPVLLLGGGSNLVVSDAGFAGTVVHTRWYDLHVVKESREHVVLRAVAGEVWDDVVSFSIAERWAGIEALSGIPGLVGATPIQNVGAYGQEVADTVVAVEVYDRHKRRRRTLDAEQCGFGYRTSRFKQEPDRFAVLAVRYRLRRSPDSGPVRYEELARTLGVEVGGSAPVGQVRRAVLELRRAKGMVLDVADHDTWSAGSFFTNPVMAASDADRLPAAAPRWVTDDGRVKVSAAWLIEQAGFGKGSGGELTGGRATLSTKHTLALTNRGGATGSDVLALARAVQDAVGAAFGVQLRPEPTIV